MKIAQTTEANLAGTNNFGAIRLLAAIMVIFGHSFDLLPGIQSEPLTQVSRGVIASHALAVDVFFVISGFLVTKSWMNRPQALSYIVARALRIMPALVVVSLLCALVLGPVVTSEPKGDYLTNPGTLWYMVSNVTLFFWQDGTLPGVFVHQPVAASVNGSLWTLPYEVFCYALILVLGLVGSRRHPRFATVAWMVATLLTPILLNLSITRVLSADIFRFLFIFGIGSACYCWGLHLHEKRLLRPGVVVIVWLVLILLTPTVASRALLLLIIPYTVLTLAYANLGQIVARIGTRHDLSYGTYLYAFPIQQMVVGGLNGKGGPLAEFAVALPITLGCAFLSWKFVESPSLRLKDRWRGGGREGEIWRLAGQRQS